MRAGRPHVLHVALPGQLPRGQLVGEVGHGGGEDAAAAHGLARRGRAGAQELRVDLAVGLHLVVRALPGDLRHVVRLRVVCGAVVRVEQHALGAQRLGEVRGSGAGSPGLVVALVLDVDDEDMLDRGHVCRRARRGTARAGRGEAQPSRANAATAVATMRPRPCRDVRSMRVTGGSIRRRGLWSSAAPTRTARGRSRPRACRPSP